MKPPSGYLLKSNVDLSSEIQTQGMQRHRINFISSPLCPNLRVMPSPFSKRITCTPNASRRESFYRTQGGWRRLYVPILSRQLGGHSFHRHCSCESDSTGYIIDSLFSRVRLWQRARQARAESIGFTTVSMYSYLTQNEVKADNGFLFLSGRALRKYFFLTLPALWSTQGASEE